MTELPDILKDSAKPFTFVETRKEAWEKYELYCWIEACNTRGLTFAFLDIDIQRAIVKRFEDAPPRKVLPA